MGPDVLRQLQEGRSILEEGDGVTATPAISYGLEVSGIGIPLEDPILRTPQTPICLLVCVDDRELVFQIIPKHPFVRRKACGVSTHVEGLDVLKEDLLPLTDVPTYACTPSFHELA